MGVLGLLAKVVSIQPPPKAFLVVAFEDFVFNIDFETLIQVIKYHSCEQASDAGADDADLERRGAVIFTGEAVYYGGDLIAALWRWLDQVSMDIVGAVVGTRTRPGMPCWISLSCSRIAMLAHRAPRSTSLESFSAYSDMVSFMGIE